MRKKNQTILEQLDISCSKGTIDENDNWNWKLHIVFNVSKYIMISSSKTKSFKNEKKVKFVKFIEKKDSHDLAAAATSAIPILRKYGPYYKNSSSFLSPNKPKI